MNICTANHFNDFWHDILPHWLTEASKTGWRERELAVVLIPYRSFASYIKSKWLQGGAEGLAGVRFWTPADCRNFLTSLLSEKPPIALREDLRLLLSIAALAVPAEPLAQTVARDADSLLYIIDRLMAAGWKTEVLSDNPIQKILQQFQLLFEQSRLENLYKIDAGLRQNPPCPKAISRLLVLGFTGAHWNDWNILAASVLASQQSTVCLLDPPLRTTRVDHLWISSWEEYFVSSEPCPDVEATESKPLSDLLMALETGQPVSEANVSSFSQLVRFLIGKDPLEEARAIVVQTIHFLSSNQVNRLGIFFPAAGALSREVTRLLTELEILHYDGICHTVAPSAAERGWLLWVKFQQSPNLTAFLNFAEWQLEQSYFSAADFSKMEEILHEAFRETLTDEVRVILGYLAQMTDVSPIYQKTVELLNHWLPLPKQAVFDEYVAATLKMVEQAGWHSLDKIIRSRARRFSDWLKEPIPIALFLQWLAAVVQTPTRGRGSLGNHPYAKVQILTYQEAENQSWSHAIFAGLNEGQWPPSFPESGFITSKEIQSLNGKVIRTGRQGEGHDVLQQGYGYLLSPEEQRALCERQLLTLIENITHTFAVSASLKIATEPTRLATPSSFLLRLFWLVNRSPLSPQQFQQLADETAQWTAKLPSFSIRPSDEQVEKTARAYQTRRQAAGTFSEYEFSFKKPPKKSVVLSCKAWEMALKNPANAWLQCILKVSPLLATEIENPSSLAIGQWLHDWLSHAFSKGTNNRFVSLPSRTAILERLQESSTQTKQRILNAFLKAGLDLPEWWIAYWKTTLSIAEDFANQISALQGWPFITSEMPLPLELSLSLKNGKKLLLRGRMDLLLSNQKMELWKTLPSDTQAWVIDFKTNDGKKLSAQSFLKGDGVQIALYGLAMDRLGFNEVHLTRLHSNLPVDSQVVLDEAREELELVLEEIYKIQESGCFGMIGELRSRYGYSPCYPLATLQIDPYLLEEKWQKLHPSLIRI